MEIKLFAWLLAFSLFLLVVHGDQKTRNSVSQNAESLVRRVGPPEDEVSEDSWQSSGDDENMEPDEDEEDVESGNGEDDTNEEVDEGDREEEDDDEEGSTGEGFPVDVPPTTSRTPMLTKCMQLRNTKQSSFKSYRPQCTENGAFEPKQCYDSTQECWCVDTEGNQIGETYRSPAEPTCPPSGIRRPGVTLPPTHWETDDIFMVDTTTRPPGDMKNSNDPKKDPDMEPLPPKTWYEYLLHEPLILAAVIGGSVLFLALLVLVLMFCVYRMRKKDEGSYSLDEPRQTFNYTRAKDQEFFA